MRCVAAYDFTSPDLAGNRVWLPTGEDWGGYTDRHMVVGGVHLIDALVMMTDMNMAAEMVIVMLLVMVLVMVLRMVLVVVLVMLIDGDSDGHGHGHAHGDGHGY